MPGPFPVRLFELIIVRSSYPLEKLISLGKEREIVTFGGGMCFALGLFRHFLWSNTLCEPTLNLG